MGKTPWVDDPIKSRSEDTLNRTHIAQHAASLINAAHSWETSVVFGLTGSWGSGKSSMISLISEQLNESNTKWITARFTPWATNDVASLTQEFFACLSAALPPKGQAGEKIRQSLRTCATITSPLLNLIPVFGGAAVEGAKVLVSALDQKQPWNEAFQEASKRIKELQTPVLVITDDIDRLQTDELVALLKVVRLLGRFPGVHFLLAYDEETLLSNLSHASIGVEDKQRARLFMEKIVQYQLTVPPLLTNQAFVLLDSGLDSIADDLERPWDAGDSRLAGLLDVFYSQFSTPRSIERFLAQLRHYLSMHELGEINDIDLLLMTFLHLQFPELYATLQTWKAPLTGGSLQMAILGLQDTQEPQWDELLGTLPEGKQRADARRVLEALFPAVGSVSRGAKIGPRVCMPEYFDRYFAHTVPEGDIANATLALALEEASDPKRVAKILMELLTSTYPGRSSLALSKLRNSTTRDNPECDLRHVVSLELVRKLAEIIGGLGDSMRSMFSDQDQAIYWVSDLIRHVSGQHSSQELLSAVRRCPQKRIQMQLLMKAAPDENTASSVVLEAAQMLSNEISADLLEHLGLQDEGSEDSTAFLSFMFVSTFGDSDGLRAEILSRLPDEFEIEDLAARFVSLSYLVGPNTKPRLDAFDQELFAKFAPATSPLYSNSVEKNVDTRDVSWANRRKYARGRATSPESTASHAP
jgi:hypothetical protein